MTLAHYTEAEDAALDAAEAAAHADCDPRECFECFEALEADEADRRFEAQRDERIMAEVERTFRGYDDGFISEDDR